eukprot:tig00000489_g1376.t1
MAFGLNANNFLEKAMAESLKEGLEKGLEKGKKEGIDQTLASLPGFSRFVIKALSPNIWPLVWPPSSSKSTQ